MTCINPYWANLTKRSRNSIGKAGTPLLKGTFQVVFKSKQKNFPVKCGKCIGCRFDHAMETSVRCYMESLEHKENCFVTLTYNQQNLPIGKDGYPTLVKSHVQSFLKRLRYYYPDKNIRYIVAGEYGPKTLRPHYHLALFGIKPEDLKKYKQNEQGDWTYTTEKWEKDIWGKGFVVIGNLTQQSGAYIARYVTKKAFTSSLARSGCIKEYIIYSKRPAVGLTNWLKNKDKYLKNGGIYIKVKDKIRLFPIPSYFQKKRKEETLSQFGLENFQYMKRLKEIEQEWGHQEEEILINKAMNAYFENMKLMQPIVIQEPYYTDKENSVKKAQERMEDILKQTDLTYSKYLKVVELKLKQNSKLLKRSKI